MQVKKRYLFIFLIVFLLTIGFVSGHAAHAEPSVESKSILFRIFLLHDWVHPVFFILMIYSCYYFRFFSGRKILREPGKCMSACSGCCKGEGWIKQHHRYFFWITLLLTFVHVGEIFPSLISSQGSNIELGVLISETSYLGFAFLYMGTCYHFRYFIERLAKRKMVSYKIYNSLTSLQRHHNLFFWITITLVIIRFTLVSIDTGSILQAIPGTF